VLSPLRHPYTSLDKSHCREVSEGPGIESRAKSKYMPHVLQVIDALQRNFSVTIISVLVRRTYAMVIRHA
jgi:hypothetical protein